MGMRCGIIIAHFLASFLFAVVLHNINSRNRIVISHNNLLYLAITDHLEQIVVRDFGGHDGILGLVVDVTEHVEAHYGGEGRDVGTCGNFVIVAMIVAIASTAPKAAATTTGAFLTIRVTGVPDGRQSQRLLRICTAKLPFLLRYNSRMLLILA